MIARCTFPAELLRPGRYLVGVSVCEMAGDEPVMLYEEHEPLLSFEVSPQGYETKVGRGLMGVAPEWSFA